MTVQDRTTGAAGHGKISARRRTGKHDDRKELLDLIVERKVHGKDEIMRVKSLIRDLAGRPDVVHPKQHEAQDFISAYLDLYLARIAGDPSVERAGLRKCLGYLGPARAPH